MALTDNAGKSHPRRLNSQLPTSDTSQLVSHSWRHQTSSALGSYSVSLLLSKVTEEPDLMKRRKTKST